MACSKKGLKVMCLKMIIKSCLYPAAFKIIYKNAEIDEMVMECRPKRWDGSICQYGSVLQLELRTVPQADLANRALGCSSTAQFSQMNSSVQREGPYLT